MPTETAATKSKSLFIKVVYKYDNTINYWAANGIEGIPSIFNLQCGDPKRHLPYWACTRVFSVQEAL